jgi:biopolymer transport protein ExbD
MRYPRNVKIFRGGVDAAPFAGLFFATMLFMVLFYSHVFFPGVPVALADADEQPAELNERTVEILRDRTVRFQAELYELKDFETEIAGLNQRGELPNRILLKSAPGAPEAAVTRVENLLKGAGVQIKLPGDRLELPEAAGFAGAPNPVVVVGVNLNGQIFYQFQKIQESALQDRLAEAVERSEHPVTLWLQADRKVPVEKITDLCNIARRAGIAEVRLATKPGPM